jgi:putative addiction module component (TIGR02574 family)
METQLPSSVPLNELLALSVPEKLALIGALSDSIEPLPVPSWQLDELARRQQADLARPEPTVSWDEAIKKVRSIDDQSSSP